MHTSTSPLKLAVVSMWRYSAGSVANWNPDSSGPVPDDVTVVSPAESTPSKVRPTVEPDTAMEVWTSVPVAVGAEVDVCGWTTWNGSHVPAGQLRVAGSPTIS